VITYHIKLAIHSVTSKLTYSILLSLAISIGVSVCVVLLNAHSHMVRDPIPNKSSQLYHVQLDSWGQGKAIDSPNKIPEKLTYLDANTLLDFNDNIVKTAIARTYAVIDKEEIGKPFSISIRANTSDLFEMFSVPFKYGKSWSQDSDKQGHNEIILTTKTNFRMFDGRNSVGEKIWVNSKLFKVVAVIDNWNPIPNFLNLSSNPFGSKIGAYIPFNTLTVNELPRSGNIKCLESLSGGNYRDFLTSECVWIDFWVYLKNKEEFKAYKIFLDSYINGQKELNRFKRPTLSKILDVNEWIKIQKITGDEFESIIVLAFMILLLCIVNSSSLLFHNFSSQKEHSKIRYYLGSSKKLIFLQYIVEAIIIGLIGGLIGLFLSILGTYGIELLYDKELSNISNMNLYQFILAISFAVLATVIAAILPAYNVAKTCMK